jgi:hypothetical protein
LKKFKLIKTSKEAGILWNWPDKLALEKKVEIRKAIEAFGGS